MDSPSSPFGPGSVSIGLYTQGQTAEEILADLTRQAVAAAAAGLDGITLAEHHGGFPSYPPNPAQLIGWLLGDAPRVWGAACPMLLPLRSPGLVVEEIAWLAARYPGRVGACFAPGYYSGDFEIAGTDFDDRGRRFARDLGLVVAALSGRATGPLAADEAVQRTAVHPIPTVSAAIGPMGVRRAAAAGTGIIIGAFNPVQKAHRLFDAYRETGGTGARLLIRRIWIGEVPPDVMDALAAPFREKGATYLETDPDAELVVADTDPRALGQRLAAAFVASGASALSVRLNLPGLPAQATLEQIARFGAEALPTLRSGLPQVALA